MDREIVLRLVLSFIVPFTVSFGLCWLFTYGYRRALEREKGEKWALYGAIQRLICLNQVDYGEPCKKILCQVCEAKTALLTVER